MSGARAKGFADWKPKPETLRIVRQAAAVIDEYSGYGPMTVRQIFYRLVGSYDYDKTEQAYKRLANYLVKARRAQMIGFDAIRDDGGTTEDPDRGWRSADHFLRDMEGWAGEFALDRSIGQPVAIELWCEAEGMVPMLSQMVQGYPVPVTGTGGFSSVTVTRSFAARVAKRKVPTVLLHVGDFDPSGESIFASMAQDIGAFVCGTFGGRWNPKTGETLELKGYDDPAAAPFFLPRRVALTAEQVDEHDLPTAPPKASDSRSASWDGETTQAEALPPDLLSEIVRDAIDEYMDPDALAAVLERERAERAVIGSKVEDAIADIRERLNDGEDGNDG